MKRLSAILLATFLLVAGHNSVAAASQTQPEVSINNIRRQYASINKRAARLKKIKKELSGFSLEGGQIVAYLDGPSIVKIVATHYGEMGRNLEEFYYSDGKLIFVYEKIFHYNKPMTGKVIRTVENRYYFDNDQLIRWVEGNGKQAVTTGEEFRNNQKEFLENSALWIAAARSKNPVVER